MVRRETESHHTILSETIRPEIEKSEAERRQIEQHVGHFIVTWAFLDFTLSMTVSAWANPTRPGKLQRPLYAQRLASKIELLQALLPADWRDGTAVIDQLRKGNAYRNTMAHQTLAVSGSDGKKRYGWHFFKIGSKSKRLELNAKSMEAESLRAEVLREALSVLMHGEYLQPTGDLNDQSLADMILQQPGTWNTRAEYNAFQAKVRAMFPG